MNEPRRYRDNDPAPALEAGGTTNLPQAHWRDVLLSGEESERWAQRIGLSLAVALLYFLAGRLGMLLAMSAGHVTPVWPPTGLALAAVWLLGRRVWPGIWLGCFCANIWGLIGSPQPNVLAPYVTAAIIGCGGTATALLGRRLMLYYCGSGNPLDRLTSVFGLMVLGGLVSCMLSATNGILCLGAGGYMPWSETAQTWGTWWLGDAAGVCVVTPVLLARNWGTAPFHWRRVFEGFVCLALVAAATGLVFMGLFTPFVAGNAFDFLLIPLLVWPAVRFGQRGAAIAVVFLALPAVWGTAHGLGPFDHANLNESLLALELFLGVVSLTALSLAAVVNERNLAAAGRQMLLDQLEQRVRQRTGELARANHNLKDEIVGRERLEAALRASERRLRTIIDTEPECVKIISKDGVLLDMNPAGLAMLDAQDLQQVTSRPLLDFIAPNDRRAFIGLHRQVLGGEVATLEFEAIGLAGTRRWLQTRAAPLRDAAGEVNAVLAVTRDFTQMRSNQQRLEALSRRLLEVQEIERRNLARELHDEIGQMLSAISINLKTIHGRIELATRPRLDECIGFVDRAIDQVRNVSLDLRPAVLDDFGLEAALRWYLHRLSDRSELSVHFVAQLSSSDLPAAVKNACFRVAQEALTNVTRHAQAQMVWLDLVEGDCEIQLTVRDDGRGFDVESARQRAAHGESLGLLSMQERVGLLGGQCDIQSRLGAGTKVCVRIPSAPFESVADGVAEWK